MLSVMYSQLTVPSDQPCGSLLKSPSPFRECFPQLQTSPSLKDVGAPALCLSSPLPAIHAPAWEHPVDFIGKKSWVFACCTLTVAPLTACRLLVVSNAEQHNTVSLANNFNFKPLISEGISYSEGLYNMSLKCLSSLTVNHSVQSSLEQIYFLLLLSNCFHKDCCKF